MILVTYKCNLRCSYCYEPKQRAFLLTAAKTKDYIMEQVRKLDDRYDSFAIQYMGGEPLLAYPLVKEVSEWLWSQSFEKELKPLFASTNGTLLNEEMKSWFADNKDRISLGLSFDGDSAMQNINRSGSSGNVDLDYFSKTWPDQSVKMTISPQTISHLSDGVMYLHDKGFKIITADLAMGTDVKWKKEDLTMLKQQLESLSAYYMEHPDYVRFSMLNLDLDSILNNEKTEKSCSCGEDFICIDHDGTEYACHLFSPVACDEDKSHRSKGIDFSNHSLFLSDKCSSCMLTHLCNRCAGMSYICYGDVCEPSPFHCAAFKIIFFANCKLVYLFAEKNKDMQKMQYFNHIIKSMSLNNK